MNGGLIDRRPDVELAAADAMSYTAAQRLDKKTLWTDIAKKPAAEAAGSETTPGSRS